MQLRSTERRENMPARRTSKKSAATRRGRGAKALAKKSTSSRVGSARAAGARRAAGKRTATTAVRRSAARKAATKASGPASASVLVVNMIPRSLSAEINQDSEPTLAVNPANPNQIVGTAFTPNPAGGATAPVFVSNDGGKTWTLNAIVPSGVNPFFGSATGDITVSFG